MIDKDTKIFDDKSLSDICKDIYTNSKEKQIKIDGVLDSVKDVLKDVSSASLLLPIIKEILDVSVRNDEQLVKLAAIIQRFLDKNDSKGNGDISMILPPEERKKLLEQRDVEGLTEEEIDQKIENLSTMVVKAKNQIKEEEKKILESVIK